MKIAQRVFPKDYKFFVPETYFFPEDYDAFQTLLMRNQTDKKTYIAKPSKGFGGHGILLI